MQKVCEQCGNPFETSHADKKYCSRTCTGKAYRLRMVGSSNPNFSDAGRKNCKGCGAEFVNYNKKRQYCTWGCYQRSGAAAANSRKNGTAGGGGCTDNNQAGIVEALRDLGASVLITSEIGKGFPDLLCGWQGRNVLLEVKNPATYYGRRGAAPNQKKWADDWTGEKPIVVFTVEDAVKAVFSASSLPEQRTS